MYKKHRQPKILYKFVYLEMIKVYFKVFKNTLKSMYICIRILQSCTVLIMFKVLYSLLFQIEFQKLINVTYL